MNPSNPSSFARPLLVSSFGIALFLAAATYASRAHADVSVNFSGCSSVTVSGNTVTCQTGTSTGGGSCSITASPSSLPSTGGSVSLTANCTGFTPTLYTWTKNGAALNSTTGNATSDTLGGNQGTADITYTYSVSGCAGSTCASNSAPVVVAKGTTGGGGGGGPVSCAGFSKTVYVDMPWGTTSRDGSTAYPRLYTNDFGGLTGHDALVIKLNPPGGVASVGAGSISLSEWGGGPYTRYAVISTTPCDFSVIPSTYNYKIATNVFYSLQVGGNQPAGVFVFQPGVTYYLNIKNANQYGTQTCPTGTTCNLSIDFTKPAGT